MYAQAIKKLSLIGVCVLALLSTAQATDTVKPMSRGEYLARAGDCSSCHISGVDKQAYAGGLAIHSPFGIIYATNITPDKDFGIGSDTLEDFSRALRKGIGKDGSPLYPAMPYPSFSALSDDDVHDLYDYFMHEVPPVHVQPPETKLSFPFNQRWILTFWNLFFSRSGPYENQTDHDLVWNRGAYLVQTIAHCGACHTPRGIGYQERGYTEASSFYMTGALEDNWFAANLTGDPASGLGQWAEGDIARFLKTGHAHKVAAFGNMAEAIENSMQFMSDDDLNAIAHYIKSLPPRGENVSYLPEKHIAAPEILHERPGAGIYMAYCSTCHHSNGGGEPPCNPQLAGNAAVLSKDATSLMRLILQGGKAPKTVSFATPGAMPGFGNKLSDQDIADVVTYIRNTWGNKATPITARDVASLRAILKQ